MSKRNSIFARRHKLIPILVSWLSAEFGEAKTIEGFGVRVQGGVAVDAER